MTQPLAPRIVLDTIADRIRPATPIVVLWYQLASHRTTYANELRSCRESIPVVPIVLRGRLFEHPNAVMEDILTIIEEHREQITHTVHNGQLALLILSHTPLAIPQVSSPTILPAWFPMHAGELIHIQIEDLTAITEAPLSELAGAKIAEYIFHLDGSLLRRLRLMDSLDTTTGSRFLEFLRAPKRTRDKFFTHLTAAERVRQSVKNPAQFRPSRDQSSIVGMIWAANETSDDAPPGSLAQALGIPPRDLPPYHEPLFAVLARPALVREPAIRMTRALVDTLSIACQAVTVGHHSDRYPKYPLALLHTTATDLARSLTSMEAAINLLPATAATSVPLVPITRPVLQ